MNRKRAVILVALLGIALASCLLAYFLHEINPAHHLEGATIFRMVQIYDALERYRENKGRWPESLSLAEAANVGIDLTSDLPLLYFPDAKPGTEAILLAQPQPCKIGPWPFVTIVQKGIRADGELIDVRGDERGVEESK